jgi:hypothetical protein
MSFFANPVQVSTLSLLSSRINFESADLSALLKVSLEPAKRTVNGAGRVMALPLNVITVAADETSGVEPLVDLVAVTTQVPALFALKLSPTIAQPVAVPLITL